MRTIVLVEGGSDQIALLTLAARRGDDLDAAGVCVVAMGGITNVYAEVQRRAASDVRFAGLYDVAQERHLGVALARSGLTDEGFFGCDPDLEHELIRAVGIEAAEAVVARQGEGRSLQRLTRMPAQRGWSRVDVLHRFIGSRSGRKARYAALLVDAVDLDAVPPPLDAVLRYALGDTSR